MEVNMISRNDFTTEVKYFGAKGQDNMFQLIGYVDVKHNDNVVFHQNLTVRTLEEVAGKSAEEIQALAQTEANEILDGDCANKCCEQYLFLVNNGLY
jgi:hypothetical protein